MNVWNRDWRRVLRSEALVYVLLGALVAGVLNVATAKVKSRQQEAALQSEVTQALDAWFEALQSRRSETVGLWLTPQFQALLANGQVLDRAGFLRQRLPLAQGAPGLHLLKVTRHEDSVVATFELHLEEGHDIKGLSEASPIMVIFQVDGDKWQLVSLIQGNRTGP